VFPYIHTALWADADYGSLNRLVEAFQDMCGNLARANLASIRNGLDHKRDEHTFPKVDEMLAFIGHFRQALDSADVQRYFPKEFWLSQWEADRYERVKLVLKDYCGRRQCLYSPSFLHKVTANISSVYPVIIGPGNILGYTNAEIYFRIGEASVYADYWSDYPRRREIPNPDKPVVDATSAATMLEANVS
jgi:hypothetical protein